MSQRREVELTADRREVARARAIVREQLAAWGLADLTGVAVAVVSELVTNALVYASGPYWLVLEHEAHAFHIGMTDSGPTWPRPAKPTEDDERGRGLLITDALTDYWNVRKTVWAHFLTSSLTAAGSPHILFPSATRPSDAAQVVVSAIREALTEHGAAHLAERFSAERALVTGEPYMAVRPMTVDQATALLDILRRGLDAA
jgi:anti-sigma regulatory factor (Ser/Thr protein kinase)